jgi:hypothetical protein
MSESLFERATRLKLRFATGKGELMVEDLWDIPLTSSTGRTCLDSIALELNSAVNPGVPMSFVNTEMTKVDEYTTTSFEIVKHVIAVRIAENRAKLEASDRAEKKQRLLGLIAKKEDEKLADTPLDDLKKMVEAL